MYGEPVTPLRLVTWLGAGIGRGLRQFWDKLSEVGRTMSAEFVRAFEAERKRAPRSARKLAMPVRGFGFFLIGFQAVPLIVLSTAEDFTSGRIVLNPVTPGIVIAGLWAFPSTWNRIPSLFQNLLLLLLAGTVEIVFASLLYLPLF